ncbi:MAG: EI24 domain-containing protein [Tistlia sp.]|uniref:EI24 domain-containing protein n=1 Tax=Tistlia sp. TaxID=3057121 RepID=UPI0034A4893C
MLSDLARAFGQLSDPAARGVLWRALFFSLLTFVALWVLAGLGLSWAGDSVVAWVKGLGVEGLLLWVVELLFGLAWISALILVSFFLFPAIVATTLSFLLDDVCRAVEARHYPGLPPAREPPLLEQIGDGLRFAAVTVGLNLLILPLYLLLIFLAPANLLLYYGLNGYLFGREYFELVAARRLLPEESRTLRKRHGGSTFASGVVVALLLTLPLVNIVTPIVATAFMLHRFEKLRRRG